MHYQEGLTFTEDRAVKFYVRVNYLESCAEVNVATAGLISFWTEMMVEANGSSHWRGKRFERESKDMVVSS